MNYLLQLVEFRKRKLCKHLTSNSICLYHTLLEFSNEIRFFGKFYRGEFLPAVEIEFIKE